MRQPVVWGAAAVALAASGSRRGRQAALRGTITAASASALANLVVKPLVRRTRPAGALDHRSVPMGSSFPSGHTASAVAFTVGAAQQLPALWAPLGLAATIVGWEQAQSQRHHRSDVIAGALLGATVAILIGRRWPAAAHHRQAA